MNNGQYVGPIISRKSPRWQRQEFYNPTTNGNLFFEPYIPPSVTAVMVTACGGGNVGASINAFAAASCHGIVFPKTDRRLFVEFAGSTVYIVVVSEAALIATTGSTGGQITLSICDHALLLQPASNITAANAIAYSRNAAGYVTAGSMTILPYLNGVLVGPNQSGTTGNMDSNSLYDPRLRATGSLTDSRTNPSGVFFPARSITSSNLVTPGCGRGSPAGSTTSSLSSAYVRLEYVV